MLFFTQIETSNVSFSLFSYFRNLFFKCDSEKLKELFLAHLLVVPIKKFYFQWRKHATFEEKSRFRTLFSHFFRSSKTCFSIRNSIKKNYFPRFLVVPRKKVTSCGASPNFSLTWFCHFFTWIEISNVSFLFFPYFRNLFFKSTFDQLKELCFAHQFFSTVKLLFLPKKLSPAA